MSTPTFALASPPLEKIPGKGQLLNALPYNSFHGVPSPTYFPYPTWERFRRPYARVTTFVVMVIVNDRHAEIH